MNPGESGVGVVIIGRNEGERLKRCLESVLQQNGTVVYVDSGSTDGSVDTARAMGVDIVELDLSIPFSAGRARNEGAFFFHHAYPEIRFVQFIDGDCELCDGWLETGRSALASNKRWGVVAGRLKERYPERSLYNRLCDLEWDTPIGETLSCGGIFMARMEAFITVGGFNPVVIAGEEPELCYRLRRAGWKIHRIDHRMALHDADMRRFSLWWRRAVRGGHAYAQGCYLHGRGPERFRVRECARIWFWAFVLPLVILSCALFLSPWWLLLLLAYPLQGARNYRRSRQKIADPATALAHALFMVLDKWAALWGQILFFKKKILGQEESIIEYKSS